LTREIMDLRQLCDYLGLSRTTVLALMKKDLPGVKLGEKRGRWRFHKVLIDKWLKEKMEVEHFDFS